MTAQPHVGVDQRDCALYRFWVRHPVTGRRVLGYIGETARMPFQRLMEHVYDKPWADTIIGWEVEPTVYQGKPAVLAAEEAAIRSEQPLYNVEHNMDNSRRVPPWDQVAQRQAREPGWRAPARSTRVPRRRAAAPASEPAGWEWTPSRVAWVIQCACWLIAACVVGWRSASGPVATWVDGVVWGPSIATFGALFVNRGRRRRGRRR